jgi:hypothetical protein
MEKNEKIKFQLNKLDVQLFENSDKIIEVTVDIGSGVGEKLNVGHNDVGLDCDMDWNTGSFLYEIPAKELVRLLTNKPLENINSEDLSDFDFELIEVADGYLNYNQVNGIDIDNADEIIESLKGTPYEIDLENDEDDKIQLIEDQMYDLYQNGEISDSEYSFGSLFSLKFDDDELGSYFVDWHYQEESSS